MKRLFKKIFGNFFSIDELTSQQLRDRFKRDYNIEVGLYSYGCFDPRRIARNTIIGKYCSFSPTVEIIGANHPIHSLSMHPYFYNKKFGYVNKESIERKQIIIEDDCWFGHGSIILSNANLIGRGSVIAAGAVVTKPVPRYAIVAGNPAKVISYRFDNEIISKIEKTKWWELDPSSVIEIKKRIKLSKN